MAYDPFDPYAGDVDPNTGMPIEQPEPEKPKRSPLNPNAPSDADLIKWYQVGPHRDPSADELAGWRSGLFTDPAASPEYIQNQIMQSGETSAWTAAHPQTGKMDDGGGSSYTPGGSSYRPGLGASGSSGGNALVKYLLGEGMNPASSNPAFSIDPNDPIIRGRVNAFGATQQKSARDSLAALAERRGPNSNIGAETRRAGEQVGAATSGYEAELLGQQMQARQEQIIAALSGALGYLTNQERNMLTEELTQMQLQQQAYQFDQNQDYLYSPFGPGMGDY